MPWPTTQSHADFHNKRRRLCGAYLLATASALALAVTLSPVAIAPVSAFECAGEGAGGGQAPNDNDQVLNTACGAGAQALGNNSTATGTAAEAIGAQSTATGNAAVARGDRSTATGRNAQATGNNSTATGDNARAGFLLSTAIGAGAATQRDNQMMLGIASTTYTARGIASMASSMAQEGVILMVTSDSNGNLATQEITASRPGATRFGSRSPAAGPGGRMAAAIVANTAEIAKLRDELRQARINARAAREAAAVSKATADALLKLVLGESATAAASGESLDREAVLALVRRDLQVARQDRSVLRRSKCALTVQNGHRPEIFIAKSARSRADHSLS